LIAEYLLLQGGGRFLIELVRTNPPVLGPLTLSQLVAICCVLSGGIALHVSRRIESFAEGR